MSVRPLRVAILLTLALLAALPALAVEPHGAMLRHPDVSATHIVFVYANDLWLVPRQGGTAIPLASPPGSEANPRFDASGETIAFMGNYDGGTDLYTVPVAGGTPFRVTYHPSTEVLTDWTPDGRLLFWSYGREWYPRAQELFSVHAGGGLPRKMPVPYGAAAAVSADGAWLAFTPHTRDHRTWKRYRGGMATDIWLFHLSEHTSRKITDWEGTDTQPMWHGGRIYYLSDAGASHRLNLWSYDPSSGERAQMTHYSDYDVKWPSIGPGAEGGGEIVFQHASDLVLLDLATGESRAVEVIIPGARPKLRAQRTAVADLITNQNISPSGKRAVVEARGDIWTLPAEHGSPRNLTQSSGVAERDPAWSPDGEWIAYFSDASGEYELYVRAADGFAAPRRLTEGADRYLYAPVWSPDSRYIAYWDQAARLWLHDVEANSSVEVHKSAAQSATSVSWSHDSGWLAFATPDDGREPNRIRLYDVEAGRLHTVTSSMFNDSWPTFDRDGDYLFFASQREFSEPIYEDVGTTWVYTHVDRLFAAPLRDDVAAPVLPTSDEEAADEAEDEGNEGEDEEAEKDDEDDEDDEAEPLAIDLDGFESRVVPLPVERGNFVNLFVNDAGHLLYGMVPASDLLGQERIGIVDPTAREEADKTVVAGTANFAGSADGKKILVAQNGQMAIVDAKADQKMDEPISTGGMVTEIDPRQEWRQIFDEAWRIERDFFYDPGMHGVDWDAVREQYAAMLADATSREDVAYVIREMISELNVGHAYYFGGDFEDEPSVSVGMLGVDWELHDGAYRIAAIVEGGPWDFDARGPLSQPGIDVGVGDYVLAVNGVPIDSARDPWAAFQGLAGTTATLTVSERPTIDDDARTVVVDAVPSESDLRYRRWVEASRRYVDEQTDGRVGYIYVPNTGIQGQNELVRQFFGQITKQGLIIDERWNGGGQVPTRFIELLDRPVANYWALREGNDWVWPPDAHHGPKAMLINGLAGSGGDYFPFWFKARGLGKLIGTRTWGGLVGISGLPRLIDGAIITAPNFAFYERDGTWGIEGHGVDPDIEVIDDPAAMVDGADPQLDAAIEQVLAEIEAYPYTPPAPPDYPDRSGMGIRPEDH